MARNVFISFRYADGYKYKEELAKLFCNSDDTVDFSEDEDRSMMSEDTIRNYLYRKLKRSSVTIVLLTPQAINHKKDWLGKYDDWMYDEIRFSLENRENNRTNGLIAVYVPEAEKSIINRIQHSCNVCNMISEVNQVLNFDNLVRANMMNVKNQYKTSKCIGTYDRDYDSYCSLVSYEDFILNFEKYIKIAIEKRENIGKYTLKVRL